MRYIPLALALSVGCSSGTLTPNRKLPELPEFRTVETAITTTIAKGATAPTVAVDTSNWRPGGIVSVEVSCEVATSDLAPLLPGSYTVTARSAAVIDSRRASA